MTETSQPDTAMNAGTSRSRLIEAGLDIFGSYGYTAATTRMIAEQGQVNLAAIPYHFGSKEGLYLAVVDHIIETVNNVLRPRLSAVQNRLEQGKLERVQAMVLIEELLGDLIDFVLGAAEAPRFGRIVLREQMSPSNAFDRIYTRIMQPVQSSLAALLAVISGNVEPSSTLQLRAFTIVGQIMAFRSGRETAVRYVGLTGYSAEETRKIRRILLEQTRATLNGLYPETGNC